MANPRKRLVTFGEILMRLSTPSYQRFGQATSFDLVFGGAEGNVAASVVQFGIPATHVTRLPNNDIGHAAIQSLRRNGIETHQIVFGTERMGLYFLETGSMHRSSRIIYDRFDTAFSNLREGELEWERIFADAEWFHYTGITPAISEGAAAVCLEAVRAARKLGVSISGDINYRRNLWQYGKGPQEVMPELISHTDLIVAGQTDIENCCGIFADSFQSSCEALLKRFPSVKHVATTLRTTVDSSNNKIEAVIFDGKRMLKSREYLLTNIVDRIGAGDAFMAGLIRGFLERHDLSHVIEFAVACCAWKHSVPGDVNLASASEIEAVVRGEGVGKLLR